MRYTIYKTTNMVNGKYYIGKHQTNNPLDSYLGSGKAIANAIKLYGRQSFKKEILFEFDNEDEMNRKERELVTEEIVNDPLSYNIGVGGEGGPHFKGKKHSNESRSKMGRHDRVFTAESRQKISDANRRRTISDETRRKISEKAKTRIHSEQSKKKISDSLKAKRVGQGR